MEEYTYNFVSQLNGVELKVNALIFAKNATIADRVFHWKMLTELTPEQYAHVILDATVNKCTVAPCTDPENSNPGIAHFSIILCNEVKKWREKLNYIFLILGSLVLIGLLIRAIILLAY